MLPCSNDHWPRTSSWLVEQSPNNPSYLEYWSVLKHDIYLKVILDEVGEPLAWFAWLRIKPPLAWKGICSEEPWFQGPPKKRPRGRIWVNFKSQTKAIYITTPLVTRFGGGTSKCNSTILFCFPPPPILARFWKIGGGGWKKSNKCCGQDVKHG